MIIYDTVIVQVSFDLFHRVEMDESNEQSTMTMTYALHHSACSTQSRQGAKAWGPVRWRAWLSRVGNIPLHRPKK